MKQNTTELENPRRRVVRKNKQRELTIGVDLGDKTSRYCVLRFGFHWLGPFAMG